MKIAIMAGGTGGHIFPGLAVACELKLLGAEVVWLGAVGGMEENLVKQHNIPIQLLAIKGLRGKGIKGLLSAPFKLWKASRSAAKYFKKENIKAVISMGGYVAGPGGLAAKFKGIPLLVHEQNSQFGMTNKYLAKWAKLTLTGFNLKGLYNSSWIGNPVRQAIVECAHCKNASNKVNILIIGGSLGARSLNTLLPRLLNEKLQNQSIAIRHQCGKNNRELTQQNYSSRDNVEISEFIKDMCKAYSWADFIIARAGALTIAEINAVGIAALLVPYPHAVDNHQTSNAQLVVDGKAGFVWQENQSKHELSHYIDQLVDDKTMRDNMAIHSKKLHQPKAAQKVAKLCMDMIQ